MHFLAHSICDSNDPAINPFNLFFTLAGFMQKVIWIRRLGLGTAFLVSRHFIKILVTYAEYRMVSKVVTI